MEGEIKSHSGYYIGQLQGALVFSSKHFLRPTHLSVHQKDKAFNKKKLAIHYLHGKLYWSAIVFTKHILFPVCQCLQAHHGLRHISNNTHKTLYN